jgi:hypothetical protein
MTRDEFFELPYSEQIQMLSDWCKENGKSIKDAKSLTEFINSLDD